MGLCNEGFNSVGERHAFHAEVAKCLAAVVVAFAGDAKAEKQRAKAPRKRAKQAASSQAPVPVQSSQAVAAPLLEDNVAELDPWAC